MNLQEVFDQLMDGELVNTSIGSDNKNSCVGCDDAKKICSHVELALLALYKRFRLKTETVDLYVVEDQTLYEVAADDILKIERVYTADDCELDFNRTDSDFSISAPTYNTIKLSEELKPQLLKVEYRAKHPKLDKDAVSFDPSNVEIELPYTHLEPLLLYVASRVLNPIGISGEFHEGNNYMAKYERACQMLEAHNYQSDNQSESNRFSDRGWV